MPFVMAKERLEAAGKLMREVKNISRHPVVRQQVPAVRQRLAWLLHSGLDIIVPTPEGGLEVEAGVGGGKTDRPPVDLYPFFASDVELGEVFVHYSQRLDLANFIPVF